MSTTNKGIILSGAPVAWIQIIADPNTPSCSETWDFDNLQSAQLKLIRSSSGKTGSNNIDINRSDGGIIRFPKDTVIISGVDESIMTEDATTSVDATGLGEIILVTNESPIGKNTASSDTTWSAFIQRLYANKDSLLLIAVPIGFTYSSKLSGTGSHKADGYYYLVCKLNSDIDMTANNTPMSLSLTFVSFKITSSASDANTAWPAYLQTVTWSDINLKLGGTNTITLNPPTITASAAADLYAGKPSIIKDFTPA